MNKALLLIDIQNDYFPGGNWELFEPDKAVQNARKALMAFRDMGLPVIHVQHVNLREGAAFFLPDTQGVEIHKALTPIPGESIVVKHAPNSFFKTELLKILQEKNISQLVVCGMMTHMCIDTTVRAAKDYGLSVQLIQDACATKELSFGGRKLSADEVNHVYFASLDKMFADIISIDGLCL